MIIVAAGNNLTQEEQILTFRYNQKNSTIKCPNCKSEVLYYDDYCYNCGNDLKNSQKKKIEEKTIINKELLLKYASVCIVRELTRNPFLFQEVTAGMTEYRLLIVDEILIHFKPITVYEVLDYIISEGYVEMLEGEEKYKAFFSHCSDEYISHLLEQNNIREASSREGNILFLVNRLPGDMLEKITSQNIIESRGSNFFEVSDKGIKLVEENPKCILYDQIFYDFNLEYFDNMIDESVKVNNVYDLLDESIDDSIEDLKWQSYSDLLFKYAEFYDYTNDSDKMLYYIIQHAICEFNPYGDNVIKSRMGIGEHLKNKIIYALSTSNKEYDELEDIIHSAYVELKLPKNFISEEDVALLLEELFLVPEIRSVNKHLISIYGFERIEEELVFKNQSEQEKIINKIENYSTQING